MPRYIVKLHDDRDGADYYMIWSTIVDAPVTRGGTLAQLEATVREENGESGIDQLPARLARVEAHGTSSQSPMTAAELISGNRAGPRETEATLHEIIDTYCRSTGDGDEEAVQ